MGVYRILLEWDDLFEEVRFRGVWVEGDVWIYTNMTQTLALICISCAGLWRVLRLLAILVHPYAYL